MATSVHFQLRKPLFLSDPVVSKCVESGDYIDYISLRRAFTRSIATKEPAHVGQLSAYKPEPQHSTRENEQHPESFLLN